MSSGYISNKSIDTKNVSKFDPVFVPVPVPVPYVRPSDWLTLPSVSTSDQKFVGLVAVFNDDTNWIALSASTNTGTYTIDWGDGVVEAIASGVTANHKYLYSDLSPSSFSTRGYRQAIVTITPTTGNLTDINLQKEYTGGEYFGTWATNARTSQWLDIKFGSPNMTTFTITTAAALTPFLPLLEQIEIVKLGVSQISIANGFRTLNSLKRLIWPNDTALTDATSAFNNSYSLENAPNFTFTGNFVGQEMFSFCRSLKYVPVYDFGNTTTSNLNNMFLNCFALPTISGFEGGSKISNTVAMFRGCSSIASIPTFNTSNVTNMTQMFETCSLLVTAPYLDTSKVTNMTNTFALCTKLTNLPLYNTSNVTNLTNTFSSCSGLITIPAWNLSNVTTLSRTFENCDALIGLPKNNLNAADMSSAFSGCAALNDVSNVGFSNVTNIGFTFNGCAALETFPFTNLNVATTLQGTFTSCSALKNINLNIPNVTTMSQTFEGCTELEQITLSNTSKVNNMFNTFNGCQSLYTVPSMNTSNVTNISGAFGGCRKIQSIPNYSMSNCTNIGGFTQCSSLTEINMTDIRIAISPTGIKLPRIGIENMMSNLRSNTAQTLTITNNPGTAPTVNKTSTWSNVSNVVTMADTTSITSNITQLTAAASFNTGYSMTAYANNKVGVSSFIDANTMISFSAVTTSNLAANTLYFVSNRADEGGGVYSYNLSTTTGGNTISFTSGTMTGRVNILITSITPNTSVTLNAFPSGNGTGGTLISRRLNTNIATFKNWTVSG
jgi:surface protein